MPFCMVYIPFPPVGDTLQRQPGMLQDTFQAWALGGGATRARGSLWSPGGGSPGKFWIKGYIYGGFHSHGGTPNWMVYFMENPTK